MGSLETLLVSTDAVLVPLTDQGNQPGPAQAGSFKGSSCLKLTHGLLSTNPHTRKAR
jgi:hypothetical protein